MNRHSLMAWLVVCAFLLNACGRDLASSNRQMTQEQALTQLEGLPSSDSDVSSEGLVMLLNDLQASGRVKLSDGRYATAGSVDLTQLTNLLSLMQGGQANSLLGLATGLINMNPGGTSTTNSSLNSILALLQAAAPIIAMIAPQYAPFIQALVVIIPLVMSFISTFKKPASASLYFPSVMPA